MGIFCDLGIFYNATKNTSLFKIIIDNKMYIHKFLFKGFCLATHNAMKKLCDQRFFSLWHTWYSPCYYVDCVTTWGVDITAGVVAALHHVQGVWNGRHLDGPDTPTLQLLTLWEPLFQNSLLSKQYISKTKIEFLISKQLSVKPR